MCVTSNRKIYSYEMNYLAGCFAGILCDQVKNELHRPIMGTSAVTSVIVDELGHRAQSSSLDSLFFVFSSLFSPSLRFINPFHLRLNWKNNFIQIIRVFIRSKALYKTTQHNPLSLHTATLVESHPPNFSNKLTTSFSKSPADGRS